LTDVVPTEQPARPSARRKAAKLNNAKRGSTPPRPIAKGGFPCFCLQNRQKAGLHGIENQ
jgi:hypothetical protein